MTKTYNLIRHPNKIAYGYQEITMEHDGETTSVRDRFISIDEAEILGQIPEYDMVPVIGKDNAPVSTVFECPLCCAIVDQQYERCPSCRHRVDPD